LFVINGIDVRIYDISDTAELHDFRNRYEDIDASYELLKTVHGQPRWFSSHEIAFMEELYNVRSLGYFIFNASDLQSVGLSPAPNGESWEMYRLLPKINGEWSDKLLRIVEVRQESPLRGSFGLWYVHFDEVREEPVMPDTEQIQEATEPTDMSEVVEQVRYYD